ncbi:MAG: four helix bundle protein [Burkholderiales bacterium]|nr:four helix bundle protein [Burkholderiales bacterium]
MKRDHRSLLAWQQAVELVEEIYQLTARFPPEERFGLVSQMRRAAVSVPANIAEGSARTGTAELLRFLSISSGSLSELDTLLAISVRLGFIHPENSLQAKIDSVTALVVAMAASLRKRR